jgi:hypothetical protein
LGVVALWIPVGFWIVENQNNIETSKQIQEVNDSIDNPGEVWTREYQYLMMELPRRDRNGILLDGPFKRIPNNNQDRIRILVVGDSYVQGAGLVNLEDRWWTVLEDELNGSTKDGTFEVVAIGTSGGSAFTYASWLEAIRDKNFKKFNGIEDEVKQTLTEPFDAVIIGYVGNDMFPSFLDEDIEGAGEIPWDVQNKISSGEGVNPYQEEYKKTPGRIKNVYTNASYFWVPMEREDPRLPEEEPWVREGFINVPMTILDEMMTKYGREKLMVNPADRHPNPAMHAAIAMDTARSILEWVPQDRLQRAIQGSESGPRRVVSGYLPTDMSIAEKDTEILISYDNGLNQGVCKASRKGYDILGCEDGQFFFYMGEDKIPGQVNPCATLGKPHIQIMFDRRRGGAILLKANKIEKKSGVLEVYGYGYIDDKFTKIIPVGDLKEGETLEISLGESVRGLFIADRDNISCEYSTGSESVIPNIELSVKTK